MKIITFIITFFLITIANAAEKKGNIPMPSIKMPSIDMKDCSSKFAKLKPRCIKFLNKEGGIVSDARKKLNDNFEKSKTK